MFEGTYDVLVQTKTKREFEGKTKNNCNFCVCVCFLSAPDPVPKRLHKSLVGEYQFVVVPVNKIITSLLKVRGFFFRTTLLKFCLTTIVLVTEKEDLFILKRFVRIPDIRKDTGMFSSLKLGVIYDQL